MDYEPDYRYTALLIIILILMALFMEPTFQINDN
jgi:hypothetical protein